MMHTQQDKSSDEISKKNNNETIAAIATAPGRASVGIVRISGPLAKNIAYQIMGKPLLRRYATFCEFYSIKQHQLIDHGLALYFPAPHSFTGEDVVELQAHGSPVVLNDLLQQTVYAGARLARAGEFSERAFLNDKIDLTQAEAIADLINAATQQAARSAVLSLQGRFSEQINEWKAELIGLRTWVEASIDFPEEEIDFIREERTVQRLEQLLTQLATIKKTATQGVLLQQGLTVVIVGQPNVGKSSLLNYLSGKDSAIVTPIAGTTRDLVKETINLDGLPLHIIDTAGLRETKDEVEQLGIAKTQQMLAQADLILYLLDASQHPNIAEQIISLKKMIENDSSLLIVNNKVDLTDEKIGISQAYDFPVIQVSIKKEQGVELLIHQIKKMAGYTQQGETGFMARRRHLDALDQTEQHIQQAIEQLERDQSSDTAAEYLRLAQNTLGHITGEFNADDLLGEIFSQFCIGK